MVENKQKTNDFEISFWKLRVSQAKIDKTREKVKCLWFEWIIIFQATVKYKTWE